MTGGDYTYCDEYWVMYRVVESLCHTSETNITLYVNTTSVINFKKIMILWVIYCSSATRIINNLVIKMKATIMQNSFLLFYSILCHLQPKPVNMAMTPTALKEHNYKKSTSTNDCQLTRCCWLQMATEI